MESRQKIKEKLSGPLSSKAGSKIVALSFRSSDATAFDVLVVHDRCLLLGVLCGIIAFLVIDVGSDRGRLTSGGGVLVFLFLGFITSTNPARVKLFCP